MHTPPLILTLALNEEAETFFNKLRQQHFPAARNFLQAHLTLFHNLPHNPELFETLIALCRQQPFFTLQAAAVVSIGCGVAYKIESEVLQQVHKRLQQQWQPWLIPQDKQTLWPHITVQNKVAPQTAKTVLQELQNGFTPFAVRGVGLRLWKYLGGPWELHETFSFIS